MNRQVKIGPQFFAKAKHDYNDWKWAWIREICQNSIDAGSTTIGFEVEVVDGNTHVTVRNNGEPMTHEILVDKLLALGESGKDFDGTTGGFGKAKELLLLTHMSWSVRSGVLLADGCGGDYSLADDLDELHGTTTAVVMEGDVSWELKKAFDQFVRYGQWRGLFTWNGVEYSADLRKGSPRRDLGFGKVYTNKSESYVLVVRMNGQPMFVKSCGLDRCVVVELEGTSGDVMTSNRDGLSWSYRQELDNFVTELSVDKRSALKPRQEKYRHYDGSRLCHRSAREVSTSDIVGIIEAPESETSDPVLDIFDGLEQGSGGTTEYHEERRERPGQKAAAYVTAEPVMTSTVTISEEFVIKNETDLVVPTYYRPDEADFSSYSRKLARIWGRLMLQLHRTFDHEADFAIGFIFPEDETEAEFEEGRFGRVYYIAPALLVEQSTTYSKSWKKRFALTERNRVLSVAVHEFVHGLGFGTHDEEYAGKLTDLMAKVMDNRKDFNWAWR